jgi:ribonucleoside-triphosphate reductase
MDFSPRAAAVTYRTYCREKEGGLLERPQEMVERAFRQHHRRLAETNNKFVDEVELEELCQLGYGKLSWVAGRTLFLGGTDYAFSRAACQFNCSFVEVSNVFDLVDAVWLLLNGSGVGFRPTVGTLRGFPRKIAVEIVPSRRGPRDKGPEQNIEDFDTVTGTWTIKVGDAAAAWAKAIGKMFQPPPGVQKLVFDGTNVRGPGVKLSGYGWICNGFEPLAIAAVAIVRILNEKAGDLLDEIDILDVVNYAGTILSSRRSAEIALLDSTNPRVYDFQRAKESYWICHDCGSGSTSGGTCKDCGSTRNNQHRRQSNNTIQFWTKPTKSRIKELLYYADNCGGDPGIMNADYARRKAPWANGVNPCTEILLPNKGFCNLVTNCLPRFGKDYAALERAIYIIARANYRQSCVDLRDGVLQPMWHQTNETLRLCGVSATGVVQADWLSDYQIRKLRDSAVRGACSQADEWDMPRPKAVTCGKPEGTGSKAMGSVKLGEIAEGINRPLGSHILNWINFSVHDPLVELHAKSGYRTMPNPSDPNNVMICFPVPYRNVKMTNVDGKEVNLEPATSQLDRYLRWNNLWADHTISATISYSENELDDVADWVDRNWDHGFISSAFLRRADPTKTAKDLGHPYLPQEVVDEATFKAYASGLQPVDYSALTGGYDVQESGCASGMCPPK